MSVKLNRSSAEETQIYEIARLLVIKVAGSAREGGLFRRDAHPKHHGCVKAWFEVNADVPAALKHGIFAESPAIVGEDTTAFATLKQSFLDRFQPATPEEDRKSVV